MAHVAKYKGGAVAAMLHHYTRDNERTLSRDNIDRERTRENYRLGPERERGREFVDERVREIEQAQGRAVRSDAVRMCDWVVTAPPDLKVEDRQRFFESAYGFFQDRYGERNMLGGWVHMDETTPHMHVAFVPVKEREDGREALSAKDVLRRAELNRVHPELSQAVERDLGYKVSIQLDGEKVLEKALSRVDGMERYQEEKDRLERLRRDREGLERRHRELGGRARGLEAEVERLRGEVERAEGRERQAEQAHQARQAEDRRVREAREAARGRVRGLEGDRDGLRSRIEGLRGRVQELGERARGLAEGLRERAGNGIERARDLLRGRGGHREQAREVDRGRENAEFDRSMTRGHEQERGQDRARGYEMERER